MWDIAQTARCLGYALAVCSNLRVTSPIRAKCATYSQYFQTATFTVDSREQRGGGEATALLLSVKQTVERGTKMRRPRVVQIGSSPF